VSLGYQYERNTKHRAEQNHWNKRVRATSIPITDALSRPRRSVQSFGNMNTGISGLDLKDATIVRVVEETALRNLTFELSYPLTEHDPDFRLKNVTFCTCRRYLVEEEHCFFGQPIIKSVEIDDQGSEGMTFRIETNYGFREVRCSFITH
jgi:hypothetical protein